MSIRRAVCLARAGAMSADGSTVAISTPHEDSAATGVTGNERDESAWDSGAVYAFLRSGDSWTQQAYIKASNTQSSDKFGFAVALSGNGDTLAVGATLEDSGARGINASQADNSAQSAGAVYVFVRTGRRWAQQAYVKAPNAEEFDQFGSGVALTADGVTLAVAANGEDSGSSIDGDQSDNSVRDSGAVYIF